MLPRHASDASLHPSEMHDVNTPLLNPHMATQSLYEIVLVI